MKLAKKLTLLAGFALACGAVALLSTPAHAVKAEDAVEAVTTRDDPTTFRVWLNRMNVQVKPNEYWRIAYEDAEGTEQWVDAAYVSVHSWDQWYAYFDVPTAILDVNGNGSFEFVPVNWNTETEAPEEDTDEGRAAVTYTAGDNAQVYYVGGEAGARIVTRGMASQWWESSHSDNNKILAQVIAEQVLQPYASCSTDKNFGAGAFDELVATWIGGLTDGNIDYTYVIGNIGDYTITEGYSVDGVAVTCNAYDKLLQMKATYDAMATPTEAIDPLNGMGAGLFSIIGVISVVALSGVFGSLYIYHRKKAR